MPLIDRDNALLLVIDFQARLMPAIHEADNRIAYATRLIRGAEILGLPRVVTEQNPRGLGGTVPGLGIPEGEALAKSSFDSTADPAIAARLANADDLIICGCEAHVCVLQTVLSLCAQERRVHVVADAVGSRSEANRSAALERMRDHGAGIVTTEMVLFEWLRDASHPAFKSVAALIK